MGSGAWIHNDVDYRCLDSLDDLNTESSVNPCEDFATAVSVWNSIPSSNLVFDEVSSGEDMTVGADDLPSNMWARNVLKISGPAIVDSDIMFNTDHSWGDRVSVDWWKWWVKDYQSTAIHEAGHSIRLTHDDTSELMRDGHGMHANCCNPYDTF